MIHASSLSIINSVRRIVQSLRVSSRQAESVMGLSSAQLFVLQKLAEAPGPVSVSELATLTLTHISSVSVVVGRLVEAGLVIKQASTQDARRLAIQISPKGEGVLKDSPRTAQEELIAAVERLPEWESSLLARLLEKLVDEAGLAGSESPMFFEDGGRSSHDDNHSG